MAATRRMAVVLKGYPRLSETFIAQELLALEQRGWSFDIWSLRHPYDGGRTHPIHDAIAATPRYLPEYLHQEPLRVLGAWWRARRLPGYRTARALWLRDLRRDPTRNRIRRWGQALVLADELAGGTDLLYAHFLHTPTSVTRYAAVLRAIRYGFSAHAKDIWTIPDWEKREKIADAEFGATCTGTGAAHLETLDAVGGKISLIYHGLDTSRFPEPPTDRGNSETFTILSVGRLVEKKGYDDLLEALSGIADLPWRFIHIGGGELKDALHARAYALGIDSRIDWQGKQDQTAVVAAMRAADIFVLPSKIAADGDRDGLPNVLMEAASQALPIVSTRVSAIPEFIRDGVDGTLVSPDDPQALADAIRAAASDHDARARMARSARARLVNDFGMDKGIERLHQRLSAALVTP